jgi:hypothetical protein
MDARGAETLMTALGFPHGVGRLYDQLLPLAGRPLEEVLAGLGITADELAARAAPLVEAEIVDLRPAGVTVLTPADAVSRMIATAAERARLAHDRLLSISRAMPYVAGSTARVPSSHLAETEQPLDGEVFSSRYLAETLSTLVAGTSGELRWLRPDQWTLPREDKMLALVATAVKSGRRARALYPVPALRDARSAIEARAEAGEEIRLLPEIPTRLLIVGTSHAVLPEPLGNTESPLVMVRQRSIVQALILLFEQMWSDAAPFALGLRRGDPARRLLLQQLASGAQDEQIARRLGLGLRTVRRRVAELMSELGAESRFQAGVEAARRGWL